MSTIDLTQFHATFYAESFDGLAGMEEQLLRLEQGARDADSLDAIFRAIHSIKGSSATFGFSEIAQFTHDLESLLDAIRKRAVEPDSAVIDLLLESVDCVRDLLTRSEKGQPAELDSAARLSARISAFQPTSKAPSSSPAASEAPLLRTFSISLRPSEHFFHGGNDPLSLFRMLQTMGDLTVCADLERLPVLSELQPENCYLAWQLTLVTEASRDDVTEVFDWVLDACELLIEETTTAAQNVPDGSAAVSPPNPVPPLEAGTEKLIQRMAVARDERVSSHIQVSTEKVDRLINLVGELVITQSMLNETAAGIGFAKSSLLLDCLTQLERNTRELQESVMSIRMVPISHVFGRYVRMVRDTGTALGKSIDLKISGEQCELDKSLIEKLVDPFAHLIRNSIDHGIEPPAERRQKGKPERGTISLHAEHKSGWVVVTIEDDGRGLDLEAIRQKAIERGLIDTKTALSREQSEQLIFAAGFSTAAQVTDVSGRGVGLDVVRNNIQSIGGAVEVSSVAGKGTRFTLRLPLTLAILDGLLLSVGTEIFVLPLTQILESLRPSREELKTIAECCHVVRIRGEYIPILALHALLDIPGGITDPQRGIIVLLESEGSRFALLVDDLVGQQQVVMKNLESNYRKVDGMLGATILGDGKVALILDVSALARMHERRQRVAA